MEDVGSFEIVGIASTAAIEFGATTPELHKELWGFVDSLGGSNLQSARVVKFF